MVGKLYTPSKNLAIYIALYLFIKQPEASKPRLYSAYCTACEGRAAGLLIKLARLTGHSR
jgi:hypothetical protein